MSGKGEEGKTTSPSTGNLTLLGKTLKGRAFLRQHQVRRLQDYSHEVGKTPVILGTKGSTGVARAGQHSWVLCWIPEEPNPELSSARGEIFSPFLYSRCSKEGERALLRRKGKPAASVFAVGKTS